VNELYDRVVRAAECFTNAMLASSWRETEYRLDMCRANNGAILTSTGHIGNFIVRFSAFKCVGFWNSYSWRYEGVSKCFRTESI